MDIAPDILQKLRTDILNCLGGETLPPEAEWLLDYRARDRIKQEVWRDLLYLLADSKLRDTSSLSPAQKFILLDSLHRQLLQEHKPLDRQFFAKIARPRLNIIREIFLDLQDIVNY
ncbi:MAG: hypothetical protein LBQ83_05920, partial [Candidatus Margulisbacteria bacterium]|nr:hypothetical protein [Candidatus Margulisiibacteriota bacterium]